jgi:hypothetical protein
MVNKFQHPVTGKILNWGDVIENFPDAFVQKPLVRILLNFD